MTYNVARAWVDDIADKRLHDCLRFAKPDLPAFSKKGGRGHLYQSYAD
jgi:hypothetical protein